ncbi:NAD(P)-binding Rossmann-fold superfamily protein [Striga asiatica]|uniref:NAD(P)-binding Rossmann-fold superfamily protein n=1 Tax=Striga asiatica TaxID=4170 RepID=A0A5A7PEL3_STRAF|nr:NAD(P)-binding Rossmann-fold superfamily protein [Striga asiatica]
MSLIDKKSLHFNIYRLFIFPSTIIECHHNDFSNQVCTCINLNYLEHYRAITENVGGIALVIEAVKSTAIRSLNSFAISIKCYLAIVWQWQITHDTVLECSAPLEY